MREYSRELDALIVRASTRKRLPLRHVRSSLHHQFCLWRAGVWARRIAKAERQNDWTTMRAYAYRQACWEARARAVDRLP
jgi:hypothetical protein